MTLKTFQLICLASVITYSTANGQGGWNIGYLPVDSVSQEHLALEVQIDFQSEESIPSGQLSIREKIYPIHSGILEIDCDRIQFYERRLIGSDYGYFKDQFLIEYLPRSSRLRLIKRSWIELVDSDLITLKIELHSYNIFEESQNIQEQVRVEFIKVPKNILDGFLIENN